MLDPGLQNLVEFTAVLVAVAVGALATFWMLG